MATHLALRKFEIDGNINLSEILNDLRRQRGMVVQNKEQYQFVCRAIADYLSPKQEAGGPPNKEQTQERPSALPKHLKTTVRPFSAPIDSDSLTPNTQRRLYLQNMLPPPPSHPPKSHTLPPNSTPPPAFTDSPLDESTPLKAKLLASISSGSSFDSIAKPSMASPSPKESSSADSSPTVTKKVSLEQLSEEKKEDEQTNRKPLIKQGQTVEEETSITILEVNYPPEDTLESPSEADKTLDFPQNEDFPKIVKPKDPEPQFKRKTSGSKTFNLKFDLSGSAASKPKSKEAKKKEPKVTALSASKKQVPKEEEKPLEQSPKLEAKKTLTEKGPPAPEEQPPILEEQPSILEEQPSILEEQPPILEEQPPILEEQPPPPEVRPRSPQRSSSPIPIIPDVPQPKESQPEEPEDTFELKRKNPRKLSLSRFKLFEQEAALTTTKSASRKEPSNVQPSEVSPISSNTSTTITTAPSTTPMTTPTTAPSVSAAKLPIAPVLPTLLPSKRRDVAKVTTSYQPKPAWLEQLKKTKEEKLKKKEEPIVSKPKIVANVDVSTFDKDALPKSQDPNLKPVSDTGLVTNKPGKLDISKFAAFGTQK